MNLDKFSANCVTKDIIMTKFIRFNVLNAQQVNIKMKLVKLYVKNVHLKHIMLDWDNKRALTVQQGILIMNLDNLNAKNVHKIAQYLI